jgi:hypothetical protein
MKFSRVLTRGAVLLALVLIPVRAAAQTAANSGQIVGQVVDGSGGAVNGAEVKVRNTETNQTRRTVTDAAGRYAVTLLPLSAYEVTVTGTGFQPSVRTVPVSLGDSTSSNFVLQVAGVEENVEVTRPPLEPTGTHSKSVLTDLQVQNLPASGRRVRSLFTLTPSTQIEPECGGFAISGQKGLYTNINVDGGDYTNTHWCGHVEFSPTFSLEALDEFQVMRSTFSAEFGRSTGGIINMSTKSGSNELRGTGFYLFRNNAMTRTDPFGRQPIGNGNQFGGSIGGPLKTDRTFFFIAPEFQYNTKPVEVLYATLDSQNVRHTPGAQELLQVAPEENLEALSQSQSIVTRIDHRFNDRHNLMGRFDYIRNRVTNNVGSMILTQGLGADSITNRALSNQVLLTNRNDITGMLQLTSVLSSTVLNEFRLQVVREFRPWNTDGSGPEVTVRNAGATVAIYGPQATGLSYGNIGYQFTDMRYQVVNNVSFVTGAHTAKVGVDSNLINGETVFAAGANGIYTFNSLADFSARRPFEYRQFAGTGALDATIHQIAFYGQDEWRVRPGLTISPGFRYEIAMLPDYVNPTVPDNRFPLATSIPDAKDLIAPRLGIVWDVNNNGKTMVRAAGGLFYAAPYMPVFEQSMLTNGGNPELSSLVIIPTTGNPNAVSEAFARFGINLGAASAGALPVFTNDQLNQLVAPANRVGQTVNYIDPDFKQPRSTHFRVALERQIGSRLTASVDFTSINTTRIARVRNLNLVQPTPDATGRPVYSTERPHGPKYGFVQVTEPSARSNYKGMTASLSARQARYVFDLYYTLGFSKSHDDTERGISSVVFDDAYNLNNEYNWSNIDQRHQFAANALVYLPHRIELSTTMRFNSGRPFSASAGSDLNRDGVQRDRPVFDGVVIPRNSYRNKGFSEVNLRVQRGFGIGNGRRAYLSLELFNLLDFDNVEIGSANMVYGPGTVIQNGSLVEQAPPAAFGQVKNADGNYLLNSTLRSAPFQAQLGLRFQF